MEESNFDKEQMFIIICFLDALTNTFYLIKMAGRAFQMKLNFEHGCIPKLS